MLKNNQTGRSMIEMLGVLAIIGVLSIGGIAGYSKAMTKYRVNKTADQISQLAQNIRTLYASQKGYNTLTLNVIKKAHLAPEEMYDGTDNTTLYNPFGGSVTVGYSGKMSSSDSKAFYITVANIPQEACVEILAQDWGASASSGLISIGYSGARYVYYGCRGDGAGIVCANDGVIPVDKAIFLCEVYAQSGITWKFY